MNLTFYHTAGYADAIVRSLHARLISKREYATLCTCETLDDLANCLQPRYNLEHIDKKPLKTLLQQHLADDFALIHASAHPQLQAFLCFIKVPYMIDNTALVLHGALSDSDATAHCHPLGIFDTLNALGSVRCFDAFYNALMAESALGPFFTRTHTDEELSENGVELARNCMYKAYLEKFHAFCTTALDGESRAGMQSVIECEADYRSLGIVCRTFDSGIAAEDVCSVLPRIGSFSNTEERERLAAVGTLQGLKCVFYRHAHLAGITHTLADADRVTFEQGFEAAALSLTRHKLKGAFAEFGTHAVFYAYFALKDAEVRNLCWIAECIVQGRREYVRDFVW